MNWVLIVVVAMLLAALVLMVGVPIALNERAARAEERRMGIGPMRPKFRKVARKSPSSLLALALASDSQAYRQVPHLSDAWPEAVAEVHKLCLAECSQTVEMYFQLNPGSAAVAALFPILDPEHPRQGRVVFPRSSTSHRQRCRYVCLCDKSDEICPTGYHLQFVEAKRGEQVDLPPPTENSACLMLSVSELSRMVGTAEWPNSSVEPFRRGSLSRYSLAGLGQAQYCYRW